MLQQQQSQSQEESEVLTENTETEDRLLEEEDEDEDLCSSSEILRLFPECNSITEENISFHEDYILHMSATLDSSPNIAVSLSRNETEVHNLSDSQLVKIADLSEHTDSLIGVKFIDSNSLYTGSSDGSILLWDLRTPTKSVLKFTDTSSDNSKKIKQFACFDVAPNNRLLCSGTDIYKSDSYILFWDVRKAKMLGAYWECHTYDITQVKFHPRDSDKLISGSTDGLINLYDLNQTSEDDALLDSLNTNSSVETLKWLNKDGKDIISCITHTSDLQFWKLDGAEPYLSFKRKNIAEAMKKRSEDNPYIVNTHSKNENFFLLSGSNAGEGACVRGLRVLKKSLSPAFSFENNKQRIRCSWFNENTNLLLTGGEKGILNAWKLNIPPV